MKTFYTKENIGSVPYTVSFHDGVKTHKDGSPFFDIRTFKRKRALSKFEKELLDSGYARQ